MSIVFSCTLSPLTITCFPFTNETNSGRSYLYYSPFTGERLMLPVSSSRAILPPSSKQLRVRPDGGVGPIPLYTGWTLGPVPKHIAAWAHSSKRAHTDGSLEPLSSSHGLPIDYAEVRGGDALLASISNGTPGARLPLVPCPDETFVSRDTGVTGEATYEFGVDTLLMLCRPCI